MNIEQKTITSMEVAEMVNKNHANLLKDIRNYVSQLAEVKTYSGDFFTESTYQDANNQTRPCFNVSKKGCEFIAHKMTGVKGTEFTAKYINRFHDMEEQIQKPMTALEKIKLTQDAVIEVSEKVEAINTDLQNFKQDLPLLGVDMDEIKKSKNRKIVPLLGGKNAPAYKDRSLCKKAYTDLEHQMNREFGVTNYKSIHRNQLSHAKEIIESYELPMCLKNEIEQANAQMRLEL